MLCFAARATHLAVAGKRMFFLLARGTDGMSFNVLGTLIGF